jgi:hypothetical protein
MTEWPQAIAPAQCDEQLSRPNVGNRKFQLDWFFLASGLAKTLANTFRSCACGGFLARRCCASKQSFDLAQLVAKDGGGNTSLGGASPSVR